MEAAVYGGPRYLDNNGLRVALRDCQIKAADTRIGGEGKLKPMPEQREYVLPENEQTKISLDEKNKIVGVSKEFLKDRIERLTTYRTVLRQRQDEYVDRLQMCELALKAQKVQSVVQDGQ